MIDQLSPHDYRRIAELLEGEVGIRLPPGKRLMVEGRLRRRVRSLDLDSLDAYCRLLFDAGELGDEMPYLIDAVTTNKTDFFREPAHFNFLATDVLPALLAERGSRRLKVWSSACSIGAEPYTLAMVLADYALGTPLQYVILGTDICTEALATARAGVYPEPMMAPVPAQMLARYVMRSRNRADRQVRIVPELRRLVRFGRLNLIKQPYPIDRDLDVIFCRNVLIYFDPANQRAVVERLAGHLRKGGYLFLGHSDCAGNDVPKLRQVAVTVYQRH